MKFASQLKKERERLGITQDECAAILQVSARSIGEWENGKTPLEPTGVGVLKILAERKPKK